MEQLIVEKLNELNILLNKNEMLNTSATRKYNRIKILSQISVLKDILNRMKVKSNV